MDKEPISELFLVFNTKNRNLPRDGNRDSSANGSCKYTISVALKIGRELSLQKICDLS